MNVYWWFTKLYTDQTIGGKWDVKDMTGGAEGQYAIQLGKCMGLKR
jgi:hypothetical protein